MKITTARLKEIIKEEIAEARLPDTMGAGYGDPQDDEREDAMGPRVPHEFSLTQKWEKDLAWFIRDLKDEQQSLNRHIKKGNRYARNLDGPYHMVISRLKSMQSDLGRDLPVRRHGQGEPIDPTKYVEAPSKMEQDQIEKAVSLVQNAFVTMARGQPVDHIQLKKDIQSAMPHGSRDYWSVKGGKSKTGGGYEYDPEMDTPTYFEEHTRANKMKITKTQLKQIIKEEIVSEGIVDVDDEIVVTGPDDDVSPEARGMARLQDAIDFLVQSERDDLAEPLIKVMELLS